jgi:hypothetical protein
MSNIAGDKYIYILVRNNELVIGGGSSTKASVRVYASQEQAIRMRDRYFPKAIVRCYQQSDLVRDV